MKYERVIKISKEAAEQINKHLHEEPTCEEECLGEDIAIVNTAIFDNGFEMDIKCCGVQYNEDEESNTAWTEAVLFLNGSEICCTEPSDEYLGEWILEYEDDEYVVSVEIEESNSLTCEKHFLDIEVGDVVVVWDEYSSHDYNEHRIKVNSIEFDDEYINGEANPKGMRCYGEDLEEEEWGDDYMTVVTEGNFVRVE